jgi:hypothetical protein
MRLIRLAQGAPLVPGRPGFPANSAAGRLCSEEPSTRPGATWLASELVPGRTGRRPANLSRGELGSEEPPTCPGASRELVPGRVRGQVVPERARSEEPRRLVRRASHAQVVPGRVGPRSLELIPERVRRLCESTGAPQSSTPSPRRRNIGGLQPYRFEHHYLFHDNLGPPPSDGACRFVDPMPCQRHRCPPRREGNSGIPPPRRTGISDTPPSTSPPPTSFETARARGLCRESS